VNFQANMTTNVTTMTNSINQMQCPPSISGGCSCVTSPNACYSTTQFTNMDAGIGELIALLLGIKAVNSQWPVALEGTHLPCCS
jgi:hypothetical protein